MPSAVLVVQPVTDFNTLLGLSNQMLGYSIASKVDASRKQHSDAARLISCLAAMRDPAAPAGITPNLFAFISFAVLIAADERDLLDILEVAAMPFVTAETIQRGIHIAVVSGTLSQWRDAVKTGASPTVELNVRACYCKIMAEFEKAGLADAWKDFTSKPLKDHTFYLEDKRK